MQPGLLYEEIEDDELWPPLAQRCRTTGRTPKEGMEFEEVCVGGVGGKAGKEKRSSGYQLGVSAWMLKAIPWSQITHFSCVRNKDIENCPLTLWHLHFQCSCSYVLARLDQHCPKQLEYSLVSELGMVRDKNVYQCSPV